MPKYYKRAPAGIINSIELFCKYHEVMHDYIEKGRIKSSLDRGAYVRPQDLLPKEIITLLGPEKNSHSNAYGPEAGDLALREKIVRLENKKRGTNYSTTNIAMMPGAWAALEFCIEEIMARSDNKKVAIVGPTLYQMFYRPIAHLNLDVIAYDFVKPGFSHVPESIGDLQDLFAEKPKVIVLTNPNNPDGKYIKSGLVKEIINRCEQENCFLIIDEMQDCLNKKGGLDYGKWIQNPNVIRVDSVSKRYALAEYRVGWVLAEARLIGDRLNGITSRMSSIMGNAPRAPNTAIMNIFDKELHAPHFLKQKNEEIEKKKAYVLGRLEKMKNIKKIIEPDACVNITVQIAYPGTDMQLAEELMKNGTLIMPASGYGYNSEDCFLRITFAERLEKLEHALDTLEKVIK
jgi:aspartate/methionine/tyrosine aminotransferase